MLTPTDTQFREPLQTVNGRVKVPLKISHLSKSNYDPIFFSFFLLLAEGTEKKRINAYNSHECNGLTGCYKQGTFFQY